jgi:ketose-bisphosphate aldolase
MFVPLKDLLEKADREGYAVPAFNYSSLWDLMAIIKTAEEEKSPVIVASNSAVAFAVGLNYCQGMAAVAMREVSVPVINHLDHSFNIDQCRAAIVAGYSSVMIDASKYSLDQNIDWIKQVKALAKTKGVHVEGELGRIKGRSLEGEYVDGDDYLIQVDEAIRLATESDVDSLAVGIGTAHGFYDGRPEINFKRLAEINRAIPTKLVLHGGTGIPAEDIREAIKNGINKVNVGTIIGYTFVETLRHYLANETKVTPLTMMAPVISNIQEAVRPWIRTCMSNGKA